MIKAILAACALLLSGPAWAGWKTEFAAEDRLRAEMREDFDLDRSAEDDGWLFYNRLRFSAKASLGNYDFFAEGMDLRVANKYIPKTAQDDSLDLHQGYAQASKLFGLPLAVKAGRQELKYGRGRLLWASNWGNRVNSIDAVVLKYKEGPLAADAFYGARAGWDPDGWNGPNRHDVLGGVYLTFQKSKDAPLADAYFLANYDGEDRSALNRRTAGLRAAARLPYGIEAEAELALPVRQKRAQERLRPRPAPGRGEGVRRPLPAAPRRRLQLRHRRQERPRFGQQQLRAAVPVLA